MTVKIWIKLPNDEELTSEFTESFLEDHPEVSGSNWDISNVTIIPYDHYASITVYNRDTNETKEIRRNFIGMTEWLLCHHDWCEEWTT